MATVVDLKKATDQCVMCGMCLPHCPTYQVSQHEAESPRGRISLVKAFSEGQLNASASLETHLQSCTGCMRCQQICPANVPYQKIIDGGRYLYREKLRPSSRLLQKLSITILTNKWGHRLLAFIGIITKRLPLKSRPLRLFKQINQYAASETEVNNQQSITIFPGCTGSIFDKQTLTSIIKILGQLQISADIPNKVMCCGALAQHSGFPQHADKHVAAIKSYLSKHDVSEFISFASGCGSQLSQHVADDHLKHDDIISWLAKSAKFKSSNFEPLPERVLIHIPCTLKNNESKYVFELLSLIPNIQLLVFNDGIYCCGAGGMQLMSPETSNRRLLKSKICTIRTIQPAMIVSSNIGCSLSLQLGLQDAGLDINVIHPVTLLAQQLKR